MRRGAWLAFASGTLALTVMLSMAGLAASRAPAAEPRKKTVEVTIHFSRFEPAVITARPGQTVTFVIHNTDPIDHEFILGDDEVQALHERGTEAVHPPRPGEVSIPARTTATTTYTLGSVGLTFACHLPGHFAYGMRGTVTVV